MKTLNLKDEQAELLLFLIREKIQEIDIAFENLQTEEAVDKFTDHYDDVIELSYDIESQLI